jgi:hypothetical protein
VFVPQGPNGTAVSVAGQANKVAGQAVADQANKVAGQVDVSLANIGGRVTTSAFVFLPPVMTMASAYKSVKKSFFQNHINGVEIVNEYSGIVDLRSP